LGTASVRRTGTWSVLACMYMLRLLIGFACFVV
jgi:hypothetical protein